MRSTDESNPAARSPWATSSARISGRSPLIVFSQVFAALRRPPHLRDQTLVEALGGVDPAVAQQQVKGNDFREHGDVLAGVQRHLDLRDIDAENGGGLEV